MAKYLISSLIKTKNVCEQITYLCHNVLLAM
jgi:hypothetical protein